MAGLSGIEDKSSQPSNSEKSERKLTVLESHGYALGKTIGAGSYATVKVAKSERHNSQVAVKIVSKFQAPGDYLKKFLPREIEVVKGLKHPNLIRFLQAIETTHRVYIVMEFAENGSLLDVIRRDSHIDETRSRRWFRQLIDAVDYCHERGVVHRDIKCENLLMDDDFNIKLSDFGFARGHMRAKNGIAPLSETFCGSYAYASPEILRGVPYQPQLSDVWSMGVVLYAMVYGRLPFDDTNYAQLLKQVQNKVTFPKEPKVSTACRALITRILVPQRSRLRITIIRNDSWLAASVAVAQTSTTDNSTDSLPTISLRGMKITSDKQGAITPPKILTKETLTAKQRSVKILNPEEETPITDVEPPPISSDSNINTISGENGKSKNRKERDLE